MDSVTDYATWIRPGAPVSRFLWPRRLLLGADVLGAVVAFLAMYLYRRFQHTPAEQMGITLLYGALIVVLALALLVVSRQYSISRRLAPLAAIGYLFRDTLMAAAITALLGYATKGFFTGLTTPSRLGVGLLIVVFAVWGTAARLVLGVVQRRQFAAGRGLRRILVAGSGRAAAELLVLISDRPQMGVVAVGKLRLAIPEWPHPEAPLAGASRRSADDSARDPLELSAEFWPTVKVADDLEGLRQLDQLLRTTQATEVIVALDPEAQGALPRLATFLSLAHVPFKVMPSLFEDTYRAGEALGQTAIPVVDLVVNPLDRVGRIFKRAMDICMAALVVVVLCPVWFIIGLAILAETGFPVIFVQERVGKNGRRFNVYKFRTMVKNAEAKLKELEPRNELDGANGRMFKMRRDPRITRVGRVLRRCSLDELPQFVNVLKGDMSVVGPRPPLPREVAQYERDHLYRLRVLPGITGLWQVSGRNELGFEEMVGLDRYYVDNWSLGLDLRIVFKTFAVLLGRKGAY